MSEYMDIPIEVIIHLVLWTSLICTMAVACMRILVFVGADLFKTPRQKDEQWMALGRVTMKRCPYCYYNWSEVNIKDCPSCGKGKPKAQGKI